MPRRSGTPPKGLTNQVEIRLLGLDLCLDLVDDCSERGERILGRGDGCLGVLDLGNE